MSLLFSLAFLFIFPACCSSRGSRWEGLCQFLFARALPVFLTMFWSSFPERVFIAWFATSWMLQLGSSGMFVCAVFYRAFFFIFFFITVTVVRQECAITCCWLLEWERLITMGPSAWVSCTVGWALCIFLALFWRAAVPGPTGSDGRRWLRLQTWQQGGRSSLMRYSSCVVCCHLGAAQLSPSVPYLFKLLFDVVKLCMWCCD